MSNVLQEKNKPVFGTIPYGDAIGFTDASAAHTYNVNTNLTVVLTGDQKGVICDSLYIVSNDSVARTVSIYIRDGAVLRLIGVFIVAAGSGTNGTALPVDVLSNANSPHLPISNQGKRYIRLLAGEEIVAGILAATSAGKFVNVVASSTIIDETV